MRVNTQQSDQPTSKGLKCATWAQWKWAERQTEGVVFRAWAVGMEVLVTPKNGAKLTCKSSKPFSRSGGWLAAAGVEVAAEADMGGPAPGMTARMRIGQVG